MTLVFFYSIGGLRWRQPSNSRRNFCLRPLALPFTILHSCPHLVRTICRPLPAPYPNPPTLHKGLCARFVFYSAAFLEQRPQQDEGSQRSRLWIWSPLVDMKIRAMPCPKTSAGKRCPPPFQQSIVQPSGVADGSHDKSGTAGHQRKTTNITGNLKQCLRWTYVSEPVR